MKLRKKCPLLVSVIFLSIVLFCYAIGLEINITPSVKKGFYIRTYGTLSKGDIISLCLGEPYKTLGLKNLYLERGKKCDGTDPLIKIVIAIPGDQVTLSDQYIEVNKIQYAYKTQYIDSIGRKLNPYPRGHYPHTNGYWVIGTNAENSWDSRYWGTITKNQILCKLKPLLTW